MSKRNNLDPLSAAYRLKVWTFVLVLVILGLILTNVASSLEASDSDWRLAVTLLNASSDILIVSGGIGIALELFTGRARTEADTERLRALLKDSAPDFRDAVVEGFAVQPDDLARVASPELLDSIAKNVLTLRLGDKQFAEEIYEDVRDQAIRAPERWHEVDVSIRLSPAGERNAKGVPLFDVTIKWEYTTIPSHSVKRFACVSDRDDFYDLTTDVPATSSWFMTPRPGLDATSRENYELLYFAVDGEERSIRRSERRSGQTYSVTIGDDIVKAGQPVRISHVYRVVTPQDGHRLYVEMPQPVRGLTLNLDYTEAPVERMSVTELVSSTRRSQVTRLPSKTNARVLSVEMPGWLLPKAGFAFVWTLVSEHSSTGGPDGAISAPSESLARPRTRNRHRSSESPSK